MTLGTPDTIRRCVVVLGLSLALAGCGPSLLQMRGTLTDSAVCCQRLSELPYSTLSPGESTVLTVGPPAYRFEGGKSYFAAYSVPTLAAPARLQVESYMQVAMASLSEEGQYIFAPQLLLLDERHAPLRSLPLRMRRMAYVPVTEFAVTGGLGWKFVHAVDLEPGDGVRHVVVHTTDALMAGSTPIEAPAARKPMRAEHGPVGRLRVSLQPVETLLDAVRIDTASPAVITLTSLSSRVPAAPPRSGETRAVPSEPPQTLRWLDFREQLPARLAGVVRHPDYPDVDLRAGLLELLVRYPNVPIGITSTGGLAITAGDYREAERRHQRWHEDPARYERERPRDRAGDRLHPLNHIEPLLGW
jgi:hypothetical protein